MTYTQVLNARGGIEADVTVTRLGEERFLVVTGTAFGPRDLAWLRARARAEDLERHVRVADVTAAWATFALWGPRARDVLAPLTPDDVSAAGFGFMRARDVTVGDVPVRAQRVTFVGELGWELSCPAEFGAALWRVLWDGGREHGLVAGGYRAIDTLRLEKGYRVWGADIGPDVTPAEAGLAWCVRDGGGFHGAEALRDQVPRTRLRCLVLDDARSVALGNEPVRLDGDVVGRVTSGGFGPTVDRSVAYAQVPPGVDVGARVEVDVFGTWVPGTVTAEPLVDPEGARIRA